MFRTKREASEAVLNHVNNLAKIGAQAQEAYKRGRA